MRHSLSLVVVAGLFAACVPSSNPYDPDTDPSLQVPGTFRGAFVYPDRSDASGIVVELAPNPVAPAVTQTETGGNGGRFAVELQPGTYWVRASATGYLPALVGPFTLVAGGDVDVGRHTLDFAPANAGIAGTVTTGGTLPTTGIKVVAMRLDEDDRCTASAGEATTGDGGAFLVDGLIPGRYVAVAFIEGATVAISDPLTLVEAETTDVTLAIVRATAPFVLADPVTGSTAYTREDQVRVTIDDAFAWASEMRFSDDPTFTQGDGWVPFAPELLFPGEGALEDTDTTIYARFQSACATSPLYAVSIIHDDEPPLLIAARLEGTDGLQPWTGDAPLVVVPDTRGALSLAIDAFDASGVAVTITATDPSGNVVVLAPEPSVGADGLVFLRTSVDLAAEEGMTHVDIEVSDAAGNVRSDVQPLAFRVLRDLSPPTTPLPAVGTLAAYGDVAYVWLAERDCKDENDVPYVALVCEENPRQTGFFEVRGGPVLLDFTPFDNPPFPIPVAHDADTVVEIRAVDEAGNSSVSVGSVTITHVETRTIQTLPTDRVFGPADAPALSSLGPTAFYEVDRRTGATSGTPVPALVAQPVDLANLGVDVTTTTLPRAVRRLSWGCTTSGTCTFFNARGAGPLGTTTGALAWLESSGDIQGDRRARIFQSRPDADGRHDIASIPSVIGTFTIVDDDDLLPAQNEEPCRDRGRLACGTVEAWAPYFQRAPRSMTTSGGRAIALNGVATKVQAFSSMENASTVTLTGPRLVGMKLTRDINVITRILGFAADLDAAPGTPLKTGAFGRYFSTGNFDAAPEDPDPDTARLGIVARGEGRETFVVPDLFESTSSGTFSAVVGVLLGPGQSLTFTIADKAAAVTPTRDAPYVVDGLVDLALVDADPDSLTLGQVDGALTPDRALTGVVYFQDNDLLGVGSVSGVTIVDIGDDDEIDGIHTPFAALGSDGPDDVNRTFGRVGLSQSAFPVADAAGTAPVVPSQCAVVLDVQDEVVLRDAVVTGQGMLDDIVVRAFKSDDGAVAGAYDPAPVFDSSSYFYLDPGPGSCRENVLATTSSLHFSGTASFTVQATQSSSFSGDLVSATGIAPTNDFLTPMTVLPVSADTCAWEIYLEAQPAPNDYGDADVYARYGADPTYDTYDHFSYAFGSDEYIHADLSLPGDVHVGVYGWEEPSPFVMQAVELVLVDTIDVPAGSSVSVSSTGTGDVDLYVQFDEKPTFFDFSCGSYGVDTSIEDCTATNENATTRTAYIAAAAYGPSTADIEATVLSGSSPIVIATIPLDGANAFVVHVADGEDVEVYAKRNGPPDFFDYDCRAYSGVDVECEPSVYQLPYAGTDVVLIAVYPTDGLTGDYDLTVDIQERGCTEVSAARYFGVSSAFASLSPGVWALTLGQLSLGNALTWPTSLPSVRQGPRVEGTGSVRVLGAPAAALIDQGALLVGGVAPATPLCDVTLTFDDRVSYTTAVAVDGAAVTARRATAVSGTARTDVLRHDDDGAPLEVADIGTGRVAALTRVGAHVVWLQTTADGQIPELVARPVDDETSTSCAPIPVDALVAPMRVIEASFRDALLFVVGETVTGPRAATVALSPGACPTAAVVDTRPVSGTPLALTGDGRDTFMSVADGATQKLVHVDGRDTIALHAGGALETVGFDVDELDVAVALAPSIGAGVTRLLLLREDAAPSGGAVTAVEVGSGTALLQPALLSDAVVALEWTGAAWGVVARPRAGGAATALSGASALFASAPAHSVDDPRALARTPVLAGDGELLAVVGWRPGGRSLSAFQLGADLVAAPVFGPVDVTGAPVALSVDDDGIVVLALEDGSSLVARGDAGSWSEVAPPPADERVLGVLDGALVVLHDPGPIVVPKPPRRLAVELRFADHSEELALAGETFLHPFTRVEMTGDGDLLLFDESATPRLLWHVDRVTGAFVPAEGPHRPLVLGTEGIGVAAAPRASGDRVVYVRRTATGNALYRMRR